MAEPIGLVSSCVGIAAVAVTVANKLDSLIQDIESAPAALAALKTQVYVFKGAITNIKMGLEVSGTDPTTLNSHSRELQVAVNGGELILKLLQDEIEIIRYDGPIRLPDGTEKTMPLKERLMFKWSEDQIVKWSDRLHRQASVLNVLLQSQRFLRESAAGMRLEDLPSPAFALDDPEQRLLQIDRSERVPEQWAKIGEGIQVDPIEKAGTQASASKPRVPAPDPGKEALGSARRKGWLTNLFSGKKQPAKAIIQRPLDSAEELLKHYRKILSSQSRTLVPDDLKFRVLLLGQAGAGKTTLLSKVLGIEYNRGELLHGKSTPPEAIKIGHEFPQENGNLILHDSGGFAAGGDNILWHARDFIDSRRSSPLADQIHCIWYLISCSSERPIAPIDEQFFAGKVVDTGEIPVFVVFTKYDLFLEQIRRELATGTPDAIVEEKADEYFNENIAGGIMKSVKDKPKFSICRVGIPKAGGEYLPVHHKDGVSFGTEILVDQMTNQLDGGYLQILWIATQQMNDETKLLQSINRSIGTFWTARKVNKYSYLPFICLCSMITVQNFVVNTAATIWQVPDLYLYGDDIIRAIFDIDNLQLYFSAGLLIYNVVGPFSLSLISEMALKIVVGTNLIGRRLFLLKSRKQDGLPQFQVDWEIQGFRKSEDRKRMIRSIDETINRIDYKKTDRMEQVMSVAKDAIKAATGHVDESFYTEERIRMLKDLSLREVS